MGQIQAKDSTKVTNSNEFCPSRVSRAAVELYYTSCEQFNCSEESKGQEIIDLNMSVISL